MFFPVQPIAYISQTIQVTMAQKSRQLWLPLLLLGLSLANWRCDARAVNVSNTWTMPQEGLNVFYRFFRDRISWFEADAVCQFHHANLVTVDNSFQFDATRDLLRELDVNDIVWIGLMRPQSSDRFMWSNSRPLVTDTGYWAESLPLMDAPLCAVIDPIRDYRWHALRCGGPETASFLCEMPVPSWADACILKDMPNLTMQYMADTASIELIRNCQEEGLMRQTCKGKEDRERALRELICPRERLETQRLSDMGNSHLKSLQIINSIRTDNDESNNIDLLPNYGRAAINTRAAPVVETTTQPDRRTDAQRIIDQFTLPGQAPMPRLRIPGQKPLPVKKAAKKAVNGDKYGKGQQPASAWESAPPKGKAAKPPQPMDDMGLMMGDQPAQGGELPLPLQGKQDSDASNEILELLPHKKKILAQDLRTMPTTREQRTKMPIPLTATEAGTATITTQAISSTAWTTTEAARATMSGLTTAATYPTAGASDAAATANTQLPGDNVGHPMHPPQPQHGSDETPPPPHTHVQESSDNSHFIPPMLLVKSHYVAKHGEHGPGHEPHGPQPHQLLTDESAPTSAATPTSSRSSALATAAAAAARPTAATSAQTGAKMKAANAANEQQLARQLNVISTPAAAAAAATVTTVTTVTTAAAAVTTAAVDVQQQPEELTTAGQTAVATTATTARTTAAAATTIISTAAAATTTAAAAATAAAAMPSTLANEAATDRTTTETEKLLTLPLDMTTTAATTTTTTTTANEISLNVTAAATMATTTAAAAAAAATTTTAANAVESTAATTHRNFLKEETEAPFKPNRRRSLTKPETVSYFKKILG